MNVLLLTQYLTGGGLERMVQLLGEELVRGHGDRVHLIAFDSVDDEVLRKRLEAVGLRCHFWPKPPGFSWNLVWSLFAYVRKEKIQVIHTHESAPLIYASIVRIASLFSVKLVHTQHSFIHLKQRPFIRHYDRFFQYLARHTIAVSEQVRQEYSRIGVPKARVKLIRNGVECADRRLSEAEKHVLREALVGECDPLARVGLKTGINDHWVISLARLHPRKGQDHLIQLWGALPAEWRARSVLIFAGPETSDGELGRLKEMAAAQPDSDRIIFVGASSSPLRWLQASDVFASASEYEGMPLAPYEAAGAGLPLLLSDIQGHKECASLYARFFPYDDAPCGAKTLVSLLEGRINDPAGNADACGRSAAIVQAEHSGRRMASAYHELYVQAAETRTRGISPLGRELRQ